MIKKLLLVITLLSIGMLLSGCRYIEAWQILLSPPTSTSMTTATFILTATSTETATPTNTATLTSTPTPTETATETITPSATTTVTGTLTITSTPTKTSTATKTNTPTKTSTPTKTGTATKTGTITVTPTPKLSGTVTQTRTITSTPTLTKTSTATGTGTVTHTPTPTLIGTSTSTSIPSVPVTLTPNITNTPLPAFTNTPKPSATPITPTPTSSSSGCNGGDTSVESAVISMVNYQREQAGIAPLTASSALFTAARNHSQDMATNNFFSHTGSNGSSASDRMISAGFSFSAAAENIYGGSGSYNSASAAVSAWMSSEGHRVNMLNPTYTFAGVGYWCNSSSTYGGYYTLDLATP